MNGSSQEIKGGTGSLKTTTSSFHIWKTHEVTHCSKARVLDGYDQPKSTKVTYVYSSKASLSLHLQQS